MRSPHKGSPTRPIRGRTLVAWAALALGWVLPLTGCQVEYAGMTLPSGKYMHDDVQYFPPGPDFPWANTQAATQRARMQAMGLEVPPPGSATTPPVAGVATPPAPPVPAPPPPAPGIAPAPAPAPPAAPADAAPAANPVPPPPAGDAAMPPPGDAK